MGDGSQERFTKLVWWTSLPVNNMFSDDKTHKCTPNTISPFAAKFVATIDMSPTANLSHLPMFVHWHSVICLGDIWFLHHKLSVGLTEGNKSSTKLRDSVQWEVGDVSFVDHCVWGKSPALRFMMSLKLTVWGFRMTWIGIAYILGNRFWLKDSAKWPRQISSSYCSHKKLAVWSSWFCNKCDQLSSLGIYYGEARQLPFSPETIELLTKPTQNLPHLLNMWSN